MPKPSGYSYSMVSEKYLTRSQVAAKLGVSVARVKALALAGRLGTMVAGRYVFSAAEVAAFAKVPRESGRPPKKSRRKPKP